MHFETRCEQFERQLNEAVAEAALQKSEAEAEVRENEFFDGFALVLSNPEKNDPPISLETLGKFRAIASQIVAVEEMTPSKTRQWEQVSAAITAGERSLQLQ